MKFNVFDENTYDVYGQEAVEEKINNRALGSLGEKISKIKHLRYRFLSDINRKPKSEPLQIALDLQANYHEAFKLMEIKIDYQTDELNRLISLTDKVILFWKDIENRKNNWKLMLPAFKELDYYIQNNYGNYVFNNVCSPKITGNEAWNVYCASELRNAALRKELADILGKTAARDEENNYYYED